MRVWNRLGQLKGNGLRIRRAVPAIVDGPGQAFRIAPAKGIFGFGKSADIDAREPPPVCPADLAPIAAGATISSSSAPPRGKYAADVHLPSCDVQHGTGICANARRQPLAYEDIARLILGPRA